MVLNQQDFKIIIDKLYMMDTDKRQQIKQQILSKKINDKVITDMVKKGHSDEIITIIDNFENIIKTESSSENNSSEESSRKYSPVSLNENSSMVLPESTEEITSKPNQKLFDLLKSETESASDITSNVDNNVTSSDIPSNVDNISMTSSIKPENLESLIDVYNDVKSSSDEKNVNEPSSEKNITPSDNTELEQDTEELYKMLKNIASDF